MHLLKKGWYRSILFGTRCKTCNFRILLPAIQLPLFPLLPRQAMAVIDCLATWKGCSVELLLTDESYMPIAEALLKKDPRVLEVVDEFYVQNAKQSKRSILLNTQRGIVKALVLYMDKDAEADKERWGLAWFASMDFMKDRVWSLST